MKFKTQDKQNQLIERISDQHLVVGVDIAQQMDSSHSNNIYDFIIVGTGPAGAVIAKTLTDDKKTSALVLEAGENNDRDRPIRDSRFALELEDEFFPEYFWQGERVPQPGVDDRTFEWTTGRPSGGGSSIMGNVKVLLLPSLH